VSSIRDSIQRVRERIEEACTRAGRPASDVRLVAVTKGVDLDRIERAAALGVKDFGENYVQEARQKIEAAREEVYWHMIGHIQTNKIKYIQGLFSYVHSADRWEVLEGLDRYGKKIRVLFELNLSGEPSKQGTSEEGLKEMLDKADKLRYIVPVGLMTMAPYVEKPEDVRGLFAQLRQTLERANRDFGLHMRELSMGMSSDFEVAIEEGSTMVRIGTAIFGERL
jgi:PLP dependent protein